MILSAQRGLVLTLKSTHLPITPPAKESSWDKPADCAPCLPGSLGVKQEDQVEPWGAREAAVGRSKEMQTGGHSRKKSIFCRCRMLVQTENSLRDQQGV